MTTATVARHANRKPDGPLGVAERNAVVEGWLARYPRPLAYLHRFRPGLVRRAKALGFGDDDLHAACLEGAVNAARLFDPALGWKFETFVGWHLVAGAERLVRQAARDRERLGGAAVGSLHHRVTNRRGESSELLDTLPAPAAGCPAERAELAAAVRAAVARACETAADRLVAAARFGLGGRAVLSLKAVADRLGVTKEAVRQREERIRRRVAEDLGGRA